jgi:hypothetical protein
MGDGRVIDSVGGGGHNHDVLDLGVSGRASLESETLLAIVRIVGRFVLGDGLASLERGTSVASLCSRLYSLGSSDFGGLGLGLSLGLDRDGLRLVIFISLRLLGLDDGGLLATDLLDDRSRSTLNVGIGVSIGIVVLCVFVALAKGHHLVLELVVGSVGRSSSLVATLRSQLIQVELRERSVY